MKLPEADLANIFRAIDALAKRGGKGAYVVAAIDASRRLQFLAREHFRREERVTLSTERGILLLSLNDANSLSYK